MKSIRYVTNGKGQQEPAPLHSTQGLTLRNANGDINSDATGFQIVIDTLTYIKKQVTKQKFYEVEFAEYIPLAVGDGAFSQNILTNLEFSNAADFETGNINAGTNNDRLAVADASVASKTIKVINWAKQVGYSIFDIEQALQANNWDVIEAKHRSRKKNWDLGLQKIAFLGSVSDTGVTGLLTNPNCTINTALITAPISGLNAANFATFVRTVISTYFTATNSTQMPTHFQIPYTDFLGLAGNLVPGTVGTYPVTMLAYLEEVFKKATMNANFKIYPLAYGDAANNAAVLGSSGKQCYTLYNMNSESLRMDVPVDYTVTQPNTVNNFQFQDVAYGQYTGVGVYRNLEVLYFRY
jgi:predicted pyridoxine 5'-phosphate oxidase superfamily flavin-nucleotide-binding protein